MRSGGAVPDPKAPWKASILAVQGHQVPAVQDFGLAHGLAQGRAGPHVLGHEPDLVLAPSDAVEEDIVKDLQETRSTFRWALHQHTIVDALTKADPLRASGATEHYLRTGWLSLADVAAELFGRAGSVKNKSRSHAASIFRLVRE